jgi:hypothetical protein
MIDFFKERYGLLLVLGVFVLLLLFAHHSAGIPSETKFAEYCLSKSGEAFAAFLGLITGSAKFAGNNGNGRLPDPKPAPAESPAAPK